MPASPTSYMGYWYSDTSIAAFAPETTCDLLALTVLGCESNLPVMVQYLGGSESIRVNIPTAVASSVVASKKVIVRVYYRVKS